MSVHIYLYLYHITMIKHSHNIQVHNKNIKTPILDRVHRSSDKLKFVAFPRLGGGGGSEVK